MEERIFARKGTEEDLFERIVEYIGYFDKNWIKGVEGATEEEIEELENIFKVIDKNFKLPKDLYNFLKYMGTNNNELIRGYYFDIKKMLINNQVYVNNLVLGERKNVSCIILARDYMLFTIIVLDLKTGNISKFSTDDIYGFEGDYTLKYIIENKYNEEFENILKDDFFKYDYKTWKRIVEEEKENGTYEQFKEEAINTNFYAPSKDSILFIANSLENFLFKLIFEKYEWNNKK